MARREITDPSAAAIAEELAEQIADFKYDPLGFVLFIYPWGEEGTKLEGETGPDQWQAEFLEDLGRECLKRGVLKAAMGAVQMACASGHGAGKTGLVAWIVHWFMSTRADPQIIVTANTQGQLTGKTWRELSKWHRLGLNADWFTWTATTFYFKARPEVHRAAAVPWTKERSEAFAGTHDKNVLMIFDEASAIDDTIWTAADGAMTTEGAIFLAFGNPTKTTGRFRECFRQFRHRWLTRHVDTRTCKQANKTQIKGWIEDYGEDSDFVRIRVKGEFPRSGTQQLIPSDVVEAARSRFRLRHGSNIRKILTEGAEGLERYKLDDNVWAPKIFVVDVARFGGDQIVFGVRQARTFVPLFKTREMSVPQVAYRADEWIKLLEPDHIVVDMAGVGGGVVDLLRDMGHEVIGAIGGNKAINERKFYNRRTEMWWKVREWLTEGQGMIPDDDQEIVDDLTGPEYGYADRGDRVQLETKDDMKARGLPSPDTADCLAMSFWMPFGPVEREEKVTVADKISRAAISEDSSWMSRAF